MLVEESVFVVDIVTGDMFVVFEPLSAVMSITISSFYLLSSCQAEDLPLNSNMRVCTSFLSSLNS